MNKSTTTSKMTRGIAAATLFVWVIAQFFCTAHCSSWKIGSSATSARNCCHDKVHQANSAAPQPAKATPPGTCFAYKTFTQASSASPSISSDNYQLADALIIDAVAEIISLESPSSVRPLARPDRAIAHEVSLGSSARAHAPPFFS